MENNSGVSIEDVQYSICQGTYGGKDWSESEKQAACQRYEQMTGTKSQTHDPSVALAVLVPLILIAIVYAAHRYKKKRRSNNKRRK